MSKNIQLIIFMAVCLIAVVLAVRTAMGALSIVSASVLWGLWGIAGGLATAMLLRRGSK